MPKYIILDVAPWAYFDDVNPRYNLDLLPYINRPEFDFYIETCPELSVLFKYLPFKYRGHLVDCIDKVQTILSNKVEEPKNEYFKTNYFANEDHHPLECNSRIIELFKRFLDETKKKGVKMVIVCSPTHVKDGCSHFDMDEFHDMVDSLAENAGIPFLDYSTLYDSDTLFFKDPMHLKRYGRERFSKTIAMTLKSLW